MSILDKNMMLTAEKHDIMAIVVDWISIYMVDLCSLGSAFLAWMFPVHFHCPVSTSLFRYVVTLPGMASGSTRLGPTFLGTEKPSPPCVLSTTSVAISSVFNIFAFRVWTVANDQ